MPRYFYGSVVVSTIEITADSQEAAEKLLTKHEYEGEDKIKKKYKLHWGETPEGNIDHERDGVLAEFLNLMKFIPRPQKNVIIDVESSIVRPWSGK